METISFISEINDLAIQLFFYRRVTFFMIFFTIILISYLVAQSIAIRKFSGGIWNKNTCQKSWGIKGVVCKFFIAITAILLLLFSVLGGFALLQNYSNKVIQVDSNGFIYEGDFFGEEDLLFLDLIDYDYVVSVEVIQDDFQKKNDFGTIALTLLSGVSGEGCVITETKYFHYQKNPEKVKEEIEKIIPPERFLKEPLK